MPLIPAQARIQISLLGPRVAGTSGSFGTHIAEADLTLTFRGADHYVLRMDDAPKPKKMSVLGTIALVVVLFGLLIAAILFAVRSWTSVEGPPMPEVGYVAMTIGVVFSLLIGIALMALLFYSSRHGYDERASRDMRVDSDREPQ
jgi:hypothetical protein